MLNRKLFGDTLEHHHLPIERDAHVTGTKGKSYSRQSITGLDSNGRPIHTASSQRLRADIALVAASLPGPGIVGGSKKAVEAIVADGLLPPAAMPAHFGAVRGMNRWEHCESGLCFGRESVSIERLEELARAYAADDPEPFISYVGPPPPDWPYQQWPYHVVRGRRMRNGCVQPVEVEVHPNPLCQEILEQIREAEVLQFIDRPRPIFNRRRLGLMNNLCLDVTYDRILTHAELVAGGTRWDRAWKANGIIPLGAADLHRAHGDLFPSEASAKDALKEARKSGGLAQIEFYLDYPPTFSYRREGQRGSSSKVMVDTMRHPDPRVAVEGVLGPLDKFEQIDSPLSAPMLLPR